MKAKICFIVDATGSMDIWMNVVSTKIHNIAEAIKMSNANTTLEIAGVFYRDFGNESQYEIIPFTQDISEFIQDFKRVEPEGGDDICEDVAGGFSKMLELDWDDADIRNAFLVCDAPPHGLEWHSPDCNDNFPNNDFNLGTLIQQTASKNIVLTVMHTSPSLVKMIRKIQEIIPTVIVIDIRERLPLRRMMTFEPQRNRLEKNTRSTNNGAGF